MRAGKLRHRVAIHQATETRDAHGEVVKTWTKIGTRWASVEPLNGREFFEAKQVDAELSHKVRMRHHCDLTPSHRIVHKGRTLEIGSVINPMERGIETVAMCKEVV